MKLMQSTALVVASVAATTAWAAQDVSLYDVEVRAELSDFSDSNALKYWPNLEADLQRAIVDRVELSGAAEDPRIEVEISKISVDGDTFLPDSGEFNELEGVVKFYEGDSAVSVQGKATSDQNLPDSSYPLRLSARSPEGNPPEGWVMVPPSQDDFYNVMVEAFADEIVEDIEQQ